MKKSYVLLLVAMAMTTVFSTAAFGQLFIEEAFKKAALPADSKGSWVIKVDVNLSKPDGTVVLQGNGDLALKGNVLEGNLALKPPKGFFIKDNTMYLYIANSKPATIRVRHDIAGKPLMGRPAEAVVLEASYRAPFSRGKVVWDSEELTISIFLSPGQQAEAGKPGIRKPPEPPTPIGIRVKVTGLMEVTNAEDGVLDNTCEIYGGVAIKLVDKNGKDYGTRQLFTLIPQDAMKGFKLNFENNLYFDRYYDEPNWSYFHIEGLIRDQDGGMVDQSDDDILFSARKGFRFGDGNDPIGQVKTYTIPGDRSSENAEVYVTVTIVEHLFKKP